jgi:hypothetical protein
MPAIDDQLKSSYAGFRSAAVMVGESAKAPDQAGALASDEEAVPS